MSKNNDFHDENFIEERPHGTMESLLAATMSYRFGYRFLQQDLFTDPQWKTVRDILERYFGMKDVTTALRYAAERVHDGLQRNPGVPGHARFRQDLDSMLCAGENDYRKGTGGGVAGDGKVGNTAENTVPPSPGEIARHGLPGGVFDVLEAAYEHFDDNQGLLRIAVYAIVSDIVPAHRYLAMAKDLAGDEWPQIRDRIVELFEEFDNKVYIGYDNRSVAYEQLLVQEQLGDAAWNYLRRRKPPVGGCEPILMSDSVEDWDSLFSTLAPVAALSQREAVVSMLMHPLQDADGDLLHEDTEKNRAKIQRIFRQCIRFGARDRAVQERERLRMMYPRRPQLQMMLDNALEEHDDDVSWGRDSR